MEFFLGSGGCIPIWFGWFGTEREHRLPSFSCLTPCYWKMPWRCAGRVLFYLWYYAKLGKREHEPHCLWMNLGFWTSGRCWWLLLGESPSAVWYMLYLVNGTIWHLWNLLLWELSLKTYTLQLAGLHRILLPGFTNWMSQASLILLVYRYAAVWGIVFYCI